MTNEYKENLLYYLTNGLKDEKGTNEPVFSEYVSTSENIKNQIANSVGLSMSDLLIVGFINPAESENFLIYSYPTSEQVSYISIFNSKMKLITTLTKFDSGSTIMRIYCMKQAEDGYIYALSQMNESGSPVVRVLLLNNILSSGLVDGEYSVSIRKSYKVTETGFRIQPLIPSRDLIIKAPDEATYYITGYNSSSLNSVIVRLKIDVSSGNTWDSYTISAIQGSHAKFSVLLNKSESGYDYYLYTYDIRNNKYVEYKVANDGTITNIKSISVSNPSFTNSMVLAVSSDNVYLCLMDSTTYVTGLYIVNGTSLELLESTAGYVDAGGRIYPAFYNLQNVNGIIFFTKYDPRRLSVNIRLAMIIDGKIYYKPDKKLETSIMYQLSSYSVALVLNDTFIKNTYNLYKVFIGSDYSDFSPTEYGTWENSTQLIYNPSNYNGEKFIDKYSLDPATGQLYDENGNIIFARNLYNKVVQGNTTEATLEVPNTLLNDKNIKSKEILSKNKNVLIQNDDIVKKNVYETLYLNFFNSLQIINKNNENYTTNPIGAIRLNNSISNLYDYEAVAITTARVNYTDDTHKIIDVSISTVENSRQIQFTFYAQKEVKNIELLSNDMETVFNTIIGSFEVGKIYKIKQLVTIDGLIIE